MPNRHLSSQYFSIHEDLPSNANNPLVYNVDMEGLNPTYYRFANINDGVLIQPTTEAGGVSTGGVKFRHDGGGTSVLIERYVNINSVDTFGSGSGYPSKLDFIKENWKEFAFDTSLSAGQTNAWIAKIPLGIKSSDDKLYIRKLSVILQNAPSSGQNVTFEVTDGTGSMTLTISNASKAGTTSTGAFIWDTNVGTGVSLVIRYTSTASLVTGRATIVVSYSEISYW